MTTPTATLPPRPAPSWGTEPFAELDRHFAELVERLRGQTSPALALAAALVSRERRAGHLCLHLPSLAGQPLAGDPDRRCPPLAEWRAELRAATPVVGQPGDFSPLILDAADRLYLQRYWAYEDRLAHDLLTRAAHPAPLDETRLQAALDMLFPPSTDGPDDQRHAAEIAARRRLCLITGGPGTGKTRTLVRILALLLELHPATSPPLRLALAAPTGKAAARIQEEVRRAAAALPAAAATAQLQETEATTLHRLLGARPDYATFRHHAHNPLPADVVVVDEASMVDLALLAKLVAAVPASARLILLGDKDQLASVEAGAVLGDLCAAPAPATLAPCLVSLRRNYRFPATSALQRLSTAINLGDPDAALAALRDPAEVLARPLPAPAALHPGGDAASAANPLAAALLAAWPERLPRDPAEMLACLGRFRILCAVRQGPYGVHAFNELAREILHRAGRLTGTGTHYAGRPLLITHNDHALRLFNGDIGVLLPGPDGGLRAFFPAPDGGVRSFPPARLPAHETVFAMTVHKSQGSEFDSVLLVLPDRDSPVLTRELLYTGLTRARQRAELWFSEPILRLAIARRVERHSGLRDRLASAG